MPDMIEFSCPYSDCGKLVKTDASFSGRTGSCPHCSRPVMVPPRHRDIAPVSTVLTTFANATIGHLRFLKGRSDGFWAYQRILSFVGVYSIVIAGVLFAMQFAMLAVKTRNVPLFFLGIAALFAAFLLHYLAARFAVSGGVMIRRNGFTTPSSNVADSVGLIGFIATVLSFFCGIGFLFAPGTLILVPICICAAFLLAHVTLMSLNPVECLNIHRDAAQSGEGNTALSIWGFFARLCVGTVPPKFALAGVASVVCAIVATILAASGPMPGSPVDVPPSIEQPASSPVPAEGVGVYQDFPFFVMADDIPQSPLFVVNAIAGILMLVAGLLPMVNYLCYLCMMLVVNFMQAVLACDRSSGDLEE